MFYIYAALAVVNFMCATVPPFDFFSVLNIGMGVWLTVIAHKEYNLQS